MPAAHENASCAGKFATLASSTAEIANLRSEACDGRMAALTDQLNVFAESLEQSKKAQQEVLNKHLQTIEGTFKQCDAILRDVKASMSAAGAAPAMPPGVLDALTRSWQPCAPTSTRWRP